jgi:NitT/TauT family transport system ATP-binding protein
LTVQEGEFVSLIGPSGCGKSTLLRILANLYQATAGEVAIRTSVDNHRPLNAVVFQEYAVFPWRTTIENVAFGLEMRGVPKTERLEIANKYLAKVGLTRFANHYVHQLSGGMKQRVAIARALANDPEILLMDEPFGALDAQTRTVMQEELLRIWEEERKTVVYVTHSIDEAVIMADRVVLMSARPGRIKSVFPIDLPRPRELKIRTTPKFNEIAQTIWVDLVEEVNRAQALERGENNGSSQ